MKPIAIRLLVFNFLLLSLFLSCPTLLAQEGWRSLTSEHYRVVGSADVRDLKLAATRLDGFRAAVLRLFRNTSYRSLVSPTVLVLDSEKELRRLALNEGQDGFFFEGESDNFILLAPEGRRNVPFIPIFHNYFHSIASENIPNVPLWLVEGLAEFYSTLDWSEDRTQILIGRPINSHIRRVRDPNNRLNLEELFSVTPESNLYDERERSSIYYAQSWAFVHFLMTRGQGQGESETVRFVQLMASGSSFEEAVDEVFSTNFRELLVEFENHLDQQGIYPYLTMPLSGGSGESIIIDQTHVSSGQAQTYLGQVLVRGGQDEAAELYFQKAVAGTQGQIYGYNSLGELRIKQKRFQEAREYLELALSSSEATHLSHFYYAKSFIEENRDVSDSLLFLVRRELKEAIQLEPEFSESYHELALTYLDRKEGLHVAVQLLETALDLRPGNQKYLMTLSEALIAQGSYESARNALRPLIHPGRNLEVQQKAESLLGSIKGMSEGGGLTGEGFNEISAAPDQKMTMEASIETYPASSGPVGMTDDRVEISRIVSGKQLQGWLNLIDCRVGLTLTILTKDDSFSFHTRVPDRVEFVTSTKAVGRELNCGPVDPPMSVIVTYREAPEGSDFLGVPIKLEFLQGPPR